VTWVRTAKLWRANQRTAKDGTIRLHTRRYLQRFEKTSRAHSYPHQPSAVPWRSHSVDSISYSHDPMPRRRAAFDGTSSKSLKYSLLISLQSEPSESTDRPLIIGFGTLTGGKFVGERIAYGGARYAN